MNGHRDERTYAIIGAAMEVHREMRKGFLEHVYHDALEIEFELRGIPYVREVELPVFYKRRQLGGTYRADFVCFDSVVVEIKSVTQLVNAHMAQTLHYLKATQHQIGLLINFGEDSLRYERVIQSA